MPTTLISLVPRGIRDFIKVATQRKVVVKETAVADSDEGLATLAMLIERFPGLKIRVDFHERFRLRTSWRSFQS